MGAGRTREVGTVRTREVGTGRTREVGAGGTRRWGLEELGSLYLMLLFRRQDDGQ